ncbi:MAG: hypothetical protein EBE86_004665 [Hormoscilla sp. GUM202]|nr:hypothetical protein [Hormoscilla sp. GM7CHS1pb]MBO1346718.1 hypothetical protein [Hormoscilla sp. GUM202]
MTRDPILEEIRRIRLEMDEACQHDEQLFYEYMCQVQEKYRDRLVRRSPQPALIPSSMPLPEQAHKGDPKASAT